MLSSQDTSVDHSGVKADGKLEGPVIPQGRHVTKIQQSEDYQSIAPPTGYLDETSNVHFEEDNPDESHAGDRNVMIEEEDGEDNDGSASDDDDDEESGIDELPTNVSSD